MKYRIVDCQFNRGIGWAKDKIEQVLDYAPSYTLIRPVLSVVYIHLASHEYGNEVMRRAAKTYFSENPRTADLACVYEHYGWFMTFLPDGTVVDTADDPATLSEKAQEWLASMKYAEWEVIQEIRRP